MRTLEIFREYPYGIWLRVDKHICMKKVTWGQRENILKKNQNRVAQGRLRPHYGGAQAAHRVMGARQGPPAAAATA